MNLFGVMDVSASALQAERVRAEVVASNMANSETTRTPDGGPYQRHHVVFQEAGDGSFQDTLSAQMGMTGFASASKTLLLRQQAAGSQTPAGGVAVTGVIEDT